MALISDQDLLEILGQLQDSTSESIVKWSVYDPSSLEFMAKTERFTYYVKSRDEDDVPPYRFQIYGNSESLGLILEVSSNTETDTVALAIGSLYATAKLSVSGIVSLRNDVLGDLRQLKHADDIF